MTNEETMETSRVETVGSMLRDARLALGLEVRDLAALTKIQGAMIQFLEEDRFEEFPAEVFARGFVRACARELRLDEDEVVALYRQQTGATAQTTPIVVEAAAPTETATQWFDTSTFGVRPVRPRLLGGQWCRDGRGLPARGLL